ncbi:hypothetical protein N5C18_10370 [Stenotrophomonas sp. GD03930]|uniref:DUF7024 domain-containing protein n=1 Tax=Stenotrophomonas sp. GD03930 TaxID=2975406 RepID=UPI00244943C0|nr:hypothetical protein [Stenotrophomonas sp. GD03930]MDH1231998.1 hypothetical protein [Stenotrophomonas sp. GD03930]
MLAVSARNGSAHWRSLFVTLGGWLAISIVTLWLLLQVPAVRTGDGSEYYAMEVALSASKHPYLTEADWNAYDTLYLSGTIESMVPTDTLKQSFPALVKDGQWDFNHFWMYPLLASIVAEPVRLMGYAVSHNASFLMLHAMMFSSLLLLAFRTYGARGVAAVMILTLASPIFWFVNKVHTEFFTFCLGCGAVLLTGRRQPGWAAVCLALASTQNISLAAPAGVLVLADFLMKWRASSIPQALRGMMPPAVLSCCLVLLHPIYYFIRHGAITPQLIAGGASTDSAGIIRGTVFLFDPDVGLFPNWPLGALLVLAFLLVRRARTDYRAPLMMTLVISYLAFNLYAQSATENVNAGATVDVARYGLWYLCLFIPGIIALIDALMASRHPRSLVAMATIGLALYIPYNIYTYNPWRYEDTGTPTRASRFVQGTLPWAYDPLPEIFFERYSTRGETDTPFSSVVVGANCRKLLVTRKDDEDLQVLGRERCAMSDAVIRALAEPVLPTGSRGVRYMELTPTQIKEAAQPIQRGVHSVAEVEGVFLSGWAAPEAWGRWSSAPSASLRMKLPDNAKLLVLRTEAFVNERHPSLKVTAVVNGVAVETYSFEATRPTRTMTLSIPSNSSTLDVQFLIDSPISPKTLGMSEDVRDLGISVSAIEVR